MSQSPTLELVAADAADTLALGARLARATAAPIVIGLSGELGTGKTTLVRGFLAALGAATPVRSPTYTLLEDYALGAVRVAHLDLYRLQSRDQIEELGIRELLDQDRVLLIEWPERGVGALPAVDVTIAFEFAEPGRRLRIEAHSESGHALVSRFSGYSGTRSE